MYMVKWSFFVLSYALHSAYYFYNFSIIKKNIQKADNI